MRRLWVAALLLLAPVAADAACTGSSPSRTAASAAQTDVAACVSVAVDGDTITVPAGSASWTTTLALGATSIKLVAGGSVQITDDSAVDITNTVSLITVTEAAAGNSQIAGFTFLQGTAAHANPAGVIKITRAVGGKPVLINGNSYTNVFNGDFIIANTNQGVIWNNTHTGYPTTGNCFNNSAFLRHKIEGLSSSWNSPSAFGSADTSGTSSLFVEANTLVNVLEGLDTDDNGRTVWRENVMVNSPVATHGVDTSGLDGGRSIEVYRNTFIRDLTPIAACGGNYVNMQGFITLRGGTGPIHHNVIPDSSTPAWGPKSTVQFTYENLRREGGGYACWGPSGPASFTALPGTYPGPHQPGWGYTSGGTTINVSGNCQQCPSTVRQDIEPIYLWANTGTGNYDSPTVADYGCDVADSTAKSCFCESDNPCTAGDITSCQAQPSATTFITPGRDYFTSTAKPGYTPYKYPHPLTGLPCLSDCGTFAVTIPGGVTLGGGVSF